jgi:transposase
MLKSTTPESEALIVELHAQGKSISQIATETGLNRSVVTQTLFVRVPDHRSPAKRALIDKIKANIDPTISLSANAKALRVNILDVKAAFSDLGLPTPTPKRNEERTKKILELRRAGLTYRAIAKEVGLSHEQVRQILQRYPAISRSSARRTRTPIDSGCWSSQ